MIERFARRLADRYREVGYAEELRERLMDELLETQLRKWGWGEGMSDT